MSSILRVHVHPATTPVDNALFAAQLAAFFLNNTSDAVVALDANGMIQSWNPAAEKIYGYCLPEIAGQHFNLLFADGTTEKERDILEKKLNGAETTTGWDTSQLHKNGSIVHTSLDIFPLFTEHGVLEGNCIVGKETARFRMMQSQLRQSQKLEAVGRLSGGIAHDFNNLLTVILGYNNMIMEKLPEGDPMRLFSVEVDKAAQQATMLTNQLLAFSRREVTQPRVLNLNEMVEDLHKMLCRIVGEDIKLVLRLAAPLHNIKADPGQISQLMTNLVVNARDAMPDGGVITIATEGIELNCAAKADEQELEPGPYVKLTISDSGAGMDEETRQHLFEPFFTTKPSGKGTGLGLSIVFGIVSQLRGNISVSTQLGQGASFAICIPTTTEELPVKHSVIAAAPRPVNPKITVLLVEDDAGVRHLVRHMLLKAGYTVYETSDSREAIRICETMPVNLLVTDIVMSSMNGRDLAAALTKDHADLRVLYMSGYTDDSLLPPSSLEPGFHFIRKPFTDARLCRQIESMFNVG
jgi:two-component system, cell cycle sensor histidine kinase and response regulator CckA